MFFFNIFYVFSLTYHVPEEVSHPVNQWTDPTDKLQVLGFGHSLLNEVEDEAGGDEGHGKNNTDCHHCINGRGQSEEETNQISTI